MGEIEPTTISIFHYLTKLIVGKILDDRWDESEEEWERSWEGGVRDLKHSLGGFVSFISLIRLIYFVLCKYLKNQ